MGRRRIRRALISVYDKSGIVAFARALHAEFGIEIISTGGTAGLLKENGIPVTLVEEITGSGAMLDGRIKTLHPKIHAGILADRDNPDHMKQLEEKGIKPIDMVVVNLYPFQKTIAKPDCTFEQAIEMIDIGGPCMLRAAAKNHKHVLVVAGHPQASLEHLRRWDDDAVREKALHGGAFDAFLETMNYDAKVASWLSRDEFDGLPDARILRMSSWGQTRYGENPHQEGDLLRLQSDATHDLTKAGSDWESDGGDTRADVEISFNNIVDANAALGLCAELSREHTKAGASGSVRSVVFIKHTNACGACVASDATEAYRMAYLGDPNAAMGGILACDFDITREFASTVMSTYAQWGKDAGAGGFFVEVWIAPSFDEQAVTAIRSAKPWGRRVRLLQEPNMTQPPRSTELDYKRIAGGMLAQTPDLVGLNEDQWRVVSERQPSEQEMAELRLAWLVCKHTKSNAITICRDGMLIGNGAGQMSRVMSCRIASWLAEENGHGDKLKGSVAASDAFFPFRDGPDILINAGVSAIIQPGGSKRDGEVIDACNEQGVAMIFTGTRHFKH